MPQVELESFNDEMLLDLVRQHEDHEAFTELFNRYWNKLLAIAYNLIQDKSAAKEIVQELFVSLWNRRLHVQIDNVNSYLATAVKFSVFKEIERRKRRRELEIARFGQADQAALDDKLEQLFIKEYLAGLLEQLPEKCALVVNYSKIQDMSNAEIAHKLNISEKTVEGHLTKGLKAIRAHLKASGLLPLLSASALVHLFK
jgi:RNA polymerase sigma-70 factor (ECF subfamily)